MQRLLIVLHLGELLLECHLIILILNVGALESLNFRTLPLRLILERSCLIFLFVRSHVRFVSLDVLLALELLQELLVADKNAVWVDYSKRKIDECEKSQVK